MARRVVPVLILVALAVTVVWWRWSADHGSNANIIRGSGIIEITEVDVAFEVPGTINERLIDEGNAVDKGDPIARLDDREYRLQRERAEAGKAAADARYAMMLKGPRGQEIDQALAAVDTANSDFAMQQTELARIRELHHQKVVSQSELDRVNMAFESSRGTRDRATAQLAMLKEGTRAEELEEARARVREAEKSVALAELQLSRCTLHAPLAGRVLSRNREAGETVAPGTSIFTLGDMQRPWLNLYVSERDLGRIALGMPAKVAVDAFPDEPFEGKVAFIAEKSEFTPKNIQTPDERVKLVYRVKIELQNRNGALKPGMPADGEITIQPNAPALATK